MRYISVLVLVMFLYSCQEKVSENIESQKLLETTTSWNGNPIPKIEGQPKVTISKVIIPPNKELPKHLHPVITTGVMLKGELTITDDKQQQITIKEGDVLVEVSNTIHFGKNTGDTDVEIVVFYIGEKDTPVTIIPKS